MQKDQQEQQAARERAQAEWLEPPGYRTDAPLPPEPDDDSTHGPEDNAFDQLWDKFEGEPYEHQVAMFLATLDDASLMDEELAFEMLNSLHEKSARRGERDRLDGLLKTLHQRLPEVYAHDAIYYLDWRIANALAAGREQQILALAAEMAAIAHQHIDQFIDTLDRLAYHGQLAALVEACRIAWPRIKESADILPWGIEEFSVLAGDWVIFDYLEHHAASAGDDSELVERLGFYIEVDPARLERYLALVTGRAGQQWTPGDFELDASVARREADREDDEESPPDEGALNLYDLSIEFLGYLRRQEEVPYSQAELAREQLLKYLLERRVGELEPEPGSQRAARGSARRGRKSRGSRPPAHPLCPDARTLDRYLGELFNLFHLEHYKAAALFEMIPAWLRFLEARRLISGEQREQTTAGLRELYAQMIEVWETHFDDPTLAAALARRWASAGTGEKGGLII
jgi:hypothetical protein